ncbi:MAG: DUF3298 domain-containing protein [Rubricoccaceae bacterium]
MRVSLLVLALLTLGAACRTDGRLPTRPPAQDSAPTAPDRVLVRADSLVRDEPALRYTVRIGYPQLDGAPSAINAAIREAVVALADRYRPTSPPRTTDPFVDRTELTGAFETAYSDQTRYSGLVEVYAYTGGAHGVTVLLPVNADLRAARLITPEDLVAPGADARALLAPYAERVLRRDQRAAGTLFPDLSPDAFRQFTAFTLGRDSLALYYAPYTLGPYASGSFRAALAYDDLEGVLRPGVAPGR